MVILGVMIYSNKLVLIQSWLPFLKNLPCSLACIHGDASIIMRKLLADRPRILLFIAMIISGSVAVPFFKADLSAKTDSRGMDRLFSIVGVIKVPPAEDPVKINLKDMNGKNTSLSDFKGKIVFLNFWTT